MKLQVGTQREQRSKPSYYSVKVKIWVGDEGVYSGASARVLTNTEIQIYVCACVCDAEMRASLQGHLR